MDIKERTRKSILARRKNGDDHYVYDLISVLYQTMVNAYEHADTVKKIDLLEDDVSEMIIRWGELE